MGKARSKGSMNPAIKNDLRREKIDRIKGGRKGGLPAGFTLPPQKMKKVKQLERYAGHVRRRQEAEAAAEAAADALGMQVEAK